MLNPDNRVWNDLKNGAIGRHAIANPKQSHRAVVSHLRFIRKSPDSVRSYFDGKTTKYATQCSDYFETMNNYVSTFSGEDHTVTLSVKLISDCNIDFFVS
jgi:hypothetical protein